MNQFQSSSLYVGDLDSDVAEANLFEIFNGIGPVASIRVCRDAITRRSLGYAYVNFHNVQDAERAIEEKNNALIKDKPCRIMWAQRDPALRKSGKGNIFIKNLDKDIDNLQLYDTFSRFGQVLSCKIESDEKGESKGYGYIQFSTQDAADKAIQTVNGNLLKGKKVFVGPFVTKKERMVANGNKKYTNVYVKNLPDTVTEEQLKTMFTPFGTVQSAVIMKGDDGSVSKGFGFVNFEEPESAEKAVDEMNNKDYEGKTIFVGRAQKRHERDSELRHKFEQMKLEQMTKYQGVNLYVKNLDDDLDEEKLRGVFDQFGTITSCKVMADPKGGSKGFGFVCFNTPEEATKAVTEMNGKIVGSKPLYVGLAQRKDARKVQLEQQFAQRKQLQRMPGPGPMAAYPGAPGAPPMGPYVFPNGQFVYPVMAPRGASGRFPPQGFPGAAPGNFMVMPNAGGRGGGMKNPRGGANPNPNNRRGMKQPGAVAQPGAVPAHDVQSGIPTQNLTAQSIAHLPTEEQKHFLGERLYPLIAKTQPNLAGKITGMILDSSYPDEILNLIDNPQTLLDKIEEAIKVLKEHESQTKPE
jgi:polyadenylate-binding protein